MSTIELINQAGWSGLTLTLDDGKLRYSGSEAAVAQWLSILREHKADVVAELQCERRRAKLLALLEGKRFALFVDDDKTDPVIAAVGIRDLATFELAIPRHSYNGMVLLELIEKHTRRETLQ